MHKSTILVLFFLLFSKNYLFSEIDTNELKPRFGIFYDYGLNIHNATFDKIPGVASCCQSYSNGYGLGPSLGLVYDYIFDKDFTISLRLKYDSHDGDLTKDESTNLIIDGKSFSGVFTHKMNTNLDLIALNPMIGYKIEENFKVFGGLGIGFNIANHFEYIETIKEPSDRGTFENGLRYRNQSSGNINEINTLQLSINLGLTYSLPLNKKRTYLLEPEIFYNFWILPQVSGISWYVHTFRAGVSLKYKQPPAPPPPPPAPLPPPFGPNPEIPGSPNIFAEITATQVDSNNVEKKDISLKIEDFISLNMRPLLNYIFFEENSFEIPSKYHKISSAETKKFSMKKITGLDILQTYYHVLNIIGKRLSDNPGTSISLVGTNADIGNEIKNKDLSYARANSIKEYFANVWGIDHKRMSIEARNLPKQPSNKKDPLAAPENRRVEIITKDWIITESVISVDTIRRISSSTIKFYPKASADVGLAKWRFIAEQEGKTYINQAGTNKFPETFSWPINEKDTNSPKIGGIITYKLAIEDSVGQTFVTEPKFLKVEQLSIDTKRINKLEDKEFEYYSLILFDYGKSTLGKEHKKVVDFVNQRVKDNSNVKIIGFTDAMGSEAINRKISLNRAKSVSNRLKLKDAQTIGVGEESILFDNTMPEGRFYCRTVQINIETPIK
jgi:outer membrane protein OmpA-like peptidoglycan-associated protein